MKGRLLESLGVVMVLATIVVVLQLTAVPIRGQGWRHERVGPSEPGGHLARRVRDTL